MDQKDQHHDGEWKCDNYNKKFVSFDIIIQENGCLQTPTATSHP
jgi:hypothetical protein